MTKPTRTLSILVVAAALLVTGCTFKKAELGSAENPVKLFFTPSVDAKVIDSNSKLMKTWLEANTPYKFEINVPQSYIAVVEAFGANRVDVAALNTFGYYLANKKYGAEARITVVRNGKTTYQSQIIAKKGRFKNLTDLEGKKIAFVDAASFSGYILPLKYLKDAGVKLGDTVFAMKHDNVVSMIYQGQVDAGATFYSPPSDKEGIQDARRLVKAQYPDVEDKIEIIKLTNDIPNDPITFRKEMPEEMKVKITDAFLAMVKTDEGKAAFKAVYGVDALQPATDKDYDSIRQMVETTGVNAEDALKAKK
ncbi:MAG: phosphate/phosphite/phosphonate ABC transporter substrate-binding protein [Bdellovibrionota bacterium]